MKTVKGAERNIQQPQVHTFVSFRPRAQFLACFLQFDHTCASELDFMLSASFSTASPATPSSSSGYVPYHADLASPVVSNSVSGTALLFSTYNSE